MLKKMAFRIVLTELSKIGMFRGRYDASNGNDSFMNGVWTVMEVIAEGAGKHDEFDELFMLNLRLSKAKAKRSRR